MTRTTETVLASVGMFVAFFVIGWVAISGDDIRAARAGVSVHEIERLDRTGWNSHQHEEDAK